MYISSPMKRAYHEVEKELRRFGVNIQSGLRRSPRLAILDKKKSYQANEALDGEIAELAYLHTNFISDLALRELNKSSSKSINIFLDMLCHVKNVDEFRNMMIFFMMN
jgi:hypothetical protein